jgi:hypothetical protein
MNADVLSDLYAGKYKWNKSKKTLVRLWKRIPKRHRNYEVGMVTELFCRYNLNIYLQDCKRLKKIYKGIEPNSYIVQYHKFKGGRKKGIDIWLRVFDENCTPTTYQIEVKGWRHRRFGISDDNYKTKILSRYETYDPLNRDVHVLMITKCNLGEVAERCMRDGIKMLPIPIQPTRSYLAFLTRFSKKNIKNNLSTIGVSLGENR